MSRLYISCACIIGYPKGGIFLTEQDNWHNGISKNMLSLIPAKGIANWLTQICMEVETDDYNQNNKGGKNA